MNMREKDKANGPKQKPLVNIDKGYIGMVWTTVVIFL